MDRNDERKRVPLNDSILDAVSGGLGCDNLITNDGSFVFWDDDLYESASLAKAAGALYTGDLMSVVAYINGEGANKTDAKRIADLTGGPNPILTPYTG